MTAGHRSAVVLAAGDSRRLGVPKQLLPYRETTLLGATLDMVRSCGFDQIVVALGKNAEAVRDRVDLAGVDAVEVEASSSGCGSSLRTAVAAVNPLADGLVLFLGDQPGIAPTTVGRLMSAAEDGPGAAAQIVVTRYRGRAGHPFWLDRTVFPAVTRLGDKGLWKLIASGRYRTATVEVDTAVPRDVDTWDDYIDLLSAAPT
ncbi:nucleotidyltransferase family protein [Williamsia sp.]|uniref:nucleotidyltransferase family protein n=1 Tax=Williamsia sp. TaxID=1872085 RepID=UPI002F93E8A7